MLTKVIIKKFKRFEDVEIELGDPVVFVGPNDSGKTSALQVLSLWETSVKNWLKKRAKSTAKIKTGVAIGVGELISVPVKEANLLWRNKSVREAHKNKKGKWIPKNRLIEIIVEGITKGSKWECGIELEYRDSKTIYCRPLRKDKTGNERMEVPEQASDISVAYLSPMSGLAISETKLTKGGINVLIGEGQTAQVLRNLCFDVLYPEGDIENPNEEKWGKLEDSVRELFGVTVNPPDYDKVRGEINMDYVDLDGATLDLSVSGRGFQQVLLLLAYMLSHPSSVVLFDEPDAHLEVLRQREIYRVLREVASESGSQLIIATHSEVVLNEAAGNDTVVAFLGPPHVLVDGGSQLQKALSWIGFDQYYQAQMKRWILYCEGSTDLSILQEFSKITGHPAGKYLERPFVKYVGNEPRAAQNHFYGLKEGVPDLHGIAVYDRIVLDPEGRTGLQELVWSRNEIENYLLLPDVLYRYADDVEYEDMFAEPIREKRHTAMETAIQKVVPPYVFDSEDDDFWFNEKITDRFLDRVFEYYFKELDIPVELRKGQYYLLVRYMEAAEVDKEIIKVLDAILLTAKKAEG